MVDVSIVIETSPEANWNRQAGRQADRRTDKPRCWEACASKKKKPIFSSYRDQNFFFKRILELAKQIAIYMIQSKTTFLNKWRTKYFIEAKMKVLNDEVTNFLETK